MKLITKSFLIVLLLLMPKASIAAERFISFVGGKVDISRPVIYVAQNDYEGVRMAAENLAADFKRVTGVKPTFTDDISKATIVVRTAKDKSLRNANEKYLLRVTDSKITIDGSDKRGSIYGIYELSRQIGVSPWYYWADVPTAHHDKVYALAGTYTDGEPAVKYRGIFLNDEWPSLGRWASEKCGGFNSKFYGKLFELVLRLKGNFMWPAMWASAFYDDDAQNGVLADKMGIVMGTSHHEPMALAQQDWKRRGKGEWNYRTNGANLRSFWRTGMERAKNWETVVTVGMRGDGDEAMESGTNIPLLENIVKDQRSIIADVTGKKAEKTPQVWALYKEVQDYYDQGMRVPDDVTLLLCDDNWGNVRKLPDLRAKKRSGGYGMYYHVDYVGAPRNSKWININNLSRMWEQLSLTYEYGVRNLWILNVGDFKPMEYPINFWFDMAWNPRQFKADNLADYSQQFCAGIFGEKFAAETSRLIEGYSWMNRRIIPEQLDADKFSFNYDEWQRVKADYDALCVDAHTLRLQLPKDLLDAYDQLVLYPVSASANLYDMYYAQAMNKKLAKENNPEANKYADIVDKCFVRDSILTDYYNHHIAGGKWNHLMDQTHIGYTIWQEPDKNIKPATVCIAADKKLQFAEKDGVVSIEAAHFSSKENGNISWVEIPRFGKTLSGMTTWQQTVTPEKASLTYEFETTTDCDNAEVWLYLAPTLNFNQNRGLRYAVSVDGGKEQIVNFNGHYRGELGQWQADPVIKSKTLCGMKAGRHTLRFRPLDAAIVLEKVIINLGGLKKSYLGPTETLKQ